MNIGKHSQREPLTPYLNQRANTFAPVSPVLKWAGGKTQLIGQFEPFFPKFLGNYHEPFLGGGAVFFNLAPRYAVQSFLSDAVPELVNFYLVLKNQTTRFISKIKELAEKYQSATSFEKKEIFYQLRALDRSKEFSDLTELERAVRFYFLNKTAFNGLHRTNSSGLFNVPWGKYEKPSLYLPEQLRTAAEALQMFAVQIKVVDFEGVLENVRPGDFVYLDPPYIPLSATSSFTSYSASGFSLDDQNRLLAVCQELNKKNVMFMLSNNDVPFIHNAYKQYRIITLSARRNINAHGEKRGRVNELIVVNY